MQDITKEKCDNIPVGTEGRLIDKRDNKIYWVGRIKNSTDNNALCWMTQNLDYDGGAVEGYSGSDVASLEGGSTFNTSTQAKKLYYNPGDYLYTLGSKTNVCSPVTTSYGLSQCTNNGWRSYISSMMEYGFMIDSTWTATSNPDFYNTASYTSADGKMVCSKNINSYFGDIASDYIPCRMYSIDYPIEFHYIAGNYYNWAGAINDAAAAADTGDGVSVNTSICPTGWKLPVSGNNSGSNNTINGSFYKLVSGLAKTKITMSPYYFTYGGNIYNGNTIASPGYAGYYWSSTASWSTQVYALQFSENSTLPSSTGDGNYLNRYNGMSVRCVAR